MSRHSAAFINVIAESGTKAEAVKYLQETWDDKCELQLLCDELSDAAKEVVRISDRKHDAWDRLKEAIDAATKKRGV